MSYRCCMVVCTSCSFLLERRIARTRRPLTFGLPTSKIPSLAYTARVPLCMVGKQVPTATNAETAQIMAQFAEMLSQRMGLVPGAEPQHGNERPGGSVVEAVLPSPRKFQGS